MTPCIEWTGWRNQWGYGRHRYHGRMWLAHRLVMAELCGFDAIEGMEVMHICDNPPCINPDHLRIGTHGDNVRDCYAKGRRGTPDYAKGEEHHFAKLTEADVRDIRRRHAAGEKGCALAAEYGVCNQTITNIHRRKRWRHVQ